MNKHKLELEEEIEATKKQLHQLAKPITLSCQKLDVSEMVRLQTRICELEKMLKEL